MAQKYEVIADRISLVVEKGSVVSVDAKQFELAEKYLKPIGNKANVETKENKKSDVETKAEEKEVKDTKAETNKNKRK